MGDLGLVYNRVRPFFIYNIGLICVFGFDASHSAHVPDTRVIIYKAHTHGDTCS